MKDKILKYIDARIIGTTKRMNRSVRYGYRSGLAERIRTLMALKKMISKLK